MMLRRLFKGLTVVVLTLLLFSCIQVLTLRYFNPPFTAFMFWHWTKAPKDFKLELDWADTSDISSNLALAILASEDQRFYEHRGFDWIEVKLAYDSNRQGKSLRGASTISMQVARNIFLWPQRMWLRKGLEVYYAMILEAFLPKNRILELYLNVAEFGPGIYGAPAAAKKYYGCPASRLSRDQSARLAYVLPAPKRRSPLKKTPYMIERKHFILKQMSYIRLEDWPR